MPRPNLLSLFAEFARYGGDVAVVQRRGYRREACTYRRLAGLAVLCAEHLKQKGVQTGDRVLVWGTNSAEWMAAFWGCLLRGAVAVPIDIGSTEHFAESVARETGAKFAFLGGGKRPLPGVAKTLNLEDLAGTAGPAATQSADVSGANHQSLADEPITRGHIAQILFTSGTTAEPRGVVLTHGNFLANLEPLERAIEPYRKYERLLHPLRFVSLVPLSHVFGQFLTLFVPPLLGSAVIFETSANASDIAKTIKRERATALIAVPHLLELMRSGMLRDLEGRAESEEFQRTFAAANGRKFLRRAWMFRRIHRRLGWKFWAFISGGAALPAETEDFFKRLGYAVVQGYGMTETASLISLNHPFRATQGSIGKVLPGREFRLAEDGEILVRGENVASGYWQQGEIRSAGALSTDSFGVADRAIGGQPEMAVPQEDDGGWLRTGDLGELDAEGNLRFRGRKKNVIVTPAGLNVYPEDLEAALRRQAGLRDCVVVPMERNGNAEACAVLLTNNVDADGAAGTVTNANRALAEYQQIRCWVVWPEPDFPRTPTGKPKLAVITARAAQVLSARHDGGPASTSGSGVLANLLADFSAAGSRTKGLERDLNLSSLERVELMSVLEQRYNVELNETAFAEARTVGDVQKLLGQPATRRTEYVYPRWAQREPVRWMRLAIYYLLVWPATQILAHPRIVGREKLRHLSTAGTGVPCPYDGPVLVVSNHITRRADIGLIRAALPSRFRHRLAIAMGGESLQRMRHPPRDWFLAKRWACQLEYWLVIALFNVFPLPQLSGFRESFRYAGESVDRRYSVLVFPEGEVNDTETGEMAPFRSGIGILARELRVPIVPMRLDGVWKMKREHRRLARFGEIVVRIGDPITFPESAPPEDITKALESAVRSL
jgi:long-chain acyl-CoA synthetase